MCTPGTIKAYLNNVFISNISLSTTEEDLISRLRIFGEISSAKVMRDVKGKSQCFGFVNFVDSEGASKAIAFLKWKGLTDEKEWCARRARNEPERVQAKLRQKFQQESIDKLTPWNLYVKNLDPRVDHEKLSELFSKFGIVTSCTVILNPEGMCRGEGFVSFSSPEEAYNAITEMNGKMVGKKFLHVALSERKEDRLARKEKEAEEGKNMQESLHSHFVKMREGNLAKGAQQDSNKQTAKVENESSRNPGKCRQKRRAKIESVEGASMSPIASNGVDRRALGDSTRVRPTFQPASEPENGDDFSFSAQPLSALIPVKPVERASYEQQMVVDISGSRGEANLFDSLYLMALESSSRKGILQELNLDPHYRATLTNNSAHESILQEFLDSLIEESKDDWHFDLCHINAARNVGPEHDKNSVDQTTINAAGQRFDYSTSIDPSFDHDENKENVEDFCGVIDPHAGSFDDMTVEDHEKSSGEVGLRIISDPSKVKDYQGLQSYGELVRSEEFAIITMNWRSKNPR